MKVLIADVNPLIRSGIAGLLSSEKDWEVCGQSSDASETPQKASELESDPILLDVSRPGAKELNTAQLLKLRIPDAKILIISQHDPKQLLPRSLEAGAVGCLDKARVATDLVPILRNVFNN